MADKIKGITLEIGGDTSGLESALNEINKQSSAVSKELKEVEKALKLDPTNVELLAQKQELLGKQAEIAAQRVEKMGEAQKIFDEAVKNGDIEKGTEEYRKFERQVATAEGQLKKASAALNDTEEATEDVGEQAEKTGKQVEKSGEGFSKFGEAAKKGAEIAAAAIATATAAAAGLVKESVEAYADYEQLVGGVEKLFGEKDSNAVAENARNAYKTAGMSANEYMETVTGFSASLISSVGGDTEEAAKLADVAITDMADNVNTFGSDLSSIQSAYAGFAKGQYTLLDNLKLGYGGTKTEMERLLADAEAFSGVKYDINSYADIVKAVHAVQEQMKITGSTAKEASSTISGSASAMKSAWQNALAGLADSNADVGALSQNLVDSISTFADNVLPRVDQSIQGISTMVSSLAEEISGLVRELLPS